MRLALSVLAVMAPKLSAAQDEEHAFIKDITSDHDPYPSHGLLNLDVDELLDDIKDLSKVAASTGDDNTVGASSIDMSPMHKFRSAEGDSEVHILSYELYFYSKCLEMTSEKEMVKEYDQWFFACMASKMEKCAMTRPVRSKRNKDLCLPNWDGKNRIGQINRNLDKMIDKIKQASDPFRNLGLGCHDDDCTIPTGLSGLWQYGCWCNFAERLMDGQSHPVNAHDSLCQSMQLCLRCARMDAVNDSPPRQCDPKTVEFVAAFGFGDESLVSACTINNPDPCARDVCTCQMALINGLVDLLWDGYVYDPAPRHIEEGGVFDYEASCPAKAGTLVDVECCGKYPTRQPYKVGSRRDCCLVSEEIYNVYESHCCADGIQNIGEPCV